MDLFSGSGTALEAGKARGTDVRRRGPLSAGGQPRPPPARRQRYDIVFADAADGGAAPPACEAEVSDGVASIASALRAFAPAPGSLPEGVAGLDAVDNWSVGYLRPDGYRCMGVVRALAPRAGAAPGAGRARLRRRTGAVRRRRHGAELLLPNRPHARRAVSAGENARVRGNAGRMQRSMGMRPAREGAPCRRRCGRGAHAVSAKRGAVAANALRWAESARQN